MEVFRIWRCGDPLKDGKGRDENSWTYNLSDNITMKTCFLDRKINEEHVDNYIVIYWMGIVHCQDRVVEGTVTVLFHLWTGCWI